MEKLVITGAAGWLGKNFLHFLQNRYRIRCLIAPWEDEETLLKINPEIEWIKGDISQENDCQRLLQNFEKGHLVHLAGIIHPKRVKQFYEVNVQGTQNLLRAAKRAGIQRAVIMSSNSPIGVNPSREHLFDELSPYNPYMHYGRSKAMMEQFVRTFDLETVIIRSPWFYGPMQPSRQVLFFKMVRDGKMPIVGDGLNRRSMAYVDHISQGILKALLAPKAAGQIYWIADAKPYTMQEIISTVENVLEERFDIPCRRKRIHLPNFFSSIAYSLDRGLQSVGLYHQKIHVLSEMNKTIACSVQKANEELGYHPDISLKEGMFRSIQSAIQQKEFP